jgi:hypothetical protein
MIDMTCMAAYHVRYSVFLRYERADFAVTLRDSRTLQLSMQQKRFYRQGKAMTFYQTDEEHNYLTHHLINSIIASCRRKCQWEWCDAVDWHLVCSALFATCNLNIALCWANWALKEQMHTAKCCMPRVVLVLALPCAVERSPSSRHRRLTCF